VAAQKLKKKLTLFVLNKQKQNVCSQQTKTKKQNWYATKPDLLCVHAVPVLLKTC